MLDPKIRIHRALYDRLARAAAVAGYASTEEFVLHILEKTAAGLGDAESEEAVKKRLQGLGYLD